MGMMKEFKEFALRGNVVDMAVGIVIGGAFGKIVSSMVGDVIMPVTGYLTGGVDFADKFFSLSGGKYTTLDAAKEAGAVTINYGLFANHVLDFVIVAFVLFMVIRGMNNMTRKDEKPPAEATTKNCGECQMEIPIKATRCGHCTASLAA